MADEVTICNLALGYLGANLITSLEDNSTEASLCKVNFPEIRDAVTTEAQWSWARKQYSRTDSPPVPQENDWKYKYRMLIPENTLRILRVYDQRQAESSFRRKRQANYSVEDGFIYVDRLPFYCDTIDRVTDMNAWSVPARMALATRIAADLAIPLTHDKNLAELYEQKYQLRLADAVNIDGTQGRAEPVVHGELINARGMGGQYWRGND